MFEKDAPIIPGMFVRHDEAGGLLYQVDDIRPDVTGWEEHHQLFRRVINYTQLEAGSFPAGTPWSRGEDDFRQNFTLEESNTNS